MMMVETELRKSTIHGIGIFLTNAVAGGALIWQFDSRLDRVYSPDEIAGLPQYAQQFLKMYSTWHEGVQLWVLCGDNGRHFNHSENPNTISDGAAFGTDVAAFDLPAGTELTSNYHMICDAVRRSGKPY